MSQLSFSWTNTDALDKYWNEFCVVFPSPIPSDTVPANIAGQLVSIIQKHRNCACALAAYVAKMTYDHPKGVPSYCQILTSIMSTPEISTLQVPWDSEPTPFDDVFSYCLYDEIDQGLEDSFNDNRLGNLAVEPSNIRLTTALLSASAINYGLHSLTNTPIAIMRIGLGEVDPGSPPEPEQREIFGVVACLLLAVAGAQIMRTSRANFEKIEGGVTHALKLMKDIQLFQLPSAVALLERTIENAETGFTKDISEKDAWDILFPSSC
ncbi:hypothetical protein BDZ97DRAFT_1815479 [Flammula alnicola]|nr:hypothetical protein BDZ97DRAFT_1815479 [Flammula alnicola]